MRIHWTSEYPEKQEQILVGPNECRVARHGERLVARHFLTDVVVAISAPVSGLSAMLRFTPPADPSPADPSPENPRDGAERFESVCHFAGSALSLFIEGLRASATGSHDASFYAVGGAAESEERIPHDERFSSAVMDVLSRQGILLRGTDLGGFCHRSVWLDARKDTLIVRSSTGAGLRQTAPLEGAWNLAS